MPNTLITIDRRCYLNLSADIARERWEKEFGAPAPAVRVLEFGDEIHLSSAGAVLGRRAAEVKAAVVDEVEELRREVAPWWRLCGLDSPRVAAIVAEIVAELQRARAKHAPMCSEFDGHGKIREEFEELWDEIKVQKPDMTRMRTEAIQLAAVTMRFVQDVCDRPVPRQDEATAGEACSHCEGQGKLFHVVGGEFITSTCPSCLGTGKGRS